MKQVLFYTSIIAWAVLQSACTKQPLSFQYLSPQQTGVQFNNSINPTDEMNILDFHYLYNGGGVGIADFNNDGLPDILFGGNQVSSELYMNKGNFKFEKSDALQTPGWVNGISIVDVNNDGLKDIYLSVGGHNCKEDSCKNLLFINTSTQNKIAFKEQAAVYNLDIDLYSQQAIFFDADNDGDLDVYQLQNYVDPTSKNYPKPKRYFSKKSYDKFYLNQEVETGKLFFKNASEKWNVNHPGFGLGVVLTDANEDGFIDVYVANDFISDDLFYINKKGKSFTEASKQLLKHTSYNGMGADASDLDNDGFEEIMVVDMLPYSNDRQKTMLGLMNYDKYKLSIREDFNSQYIRNTLQKHNQTNTKNEVLPFTEIGAYSNVYQTDWSWAPLFADYNNDGLTDLYITNGYASNITDLDFVNYNNNQKNPFAGEASAKKEILKNLEKQGAVKLNNAYFENIGNFKFNNQTNVHLKNSPSLSNGAAYADLDLDGDLDLIVNNINQPAFIMKNNNVDAGNYLSIKIEGDKLNKDAIGSKVSIWHDGKMQKKLLSPVKGYLSSVETNLHFGLGNVTIVDSLKVFWYDGSISKMKNIETNQILKINKSNSTATLKTSKKTVQPTTDFVLKDTLVSVVSKQSPHDFSIQSLLLRQYSSKGFVMAKSIPNTNGQSFVFVGGPSGFVSEIYKNGTTLQEHQKLRDQGKAVFDAVFFDYDADGDEDLYIAYGGYSQDKNEVSYFDQIFFNEDDVFYEISEQSIENLASSCIAANDHDKDSDIDIFVGSAVVPQNYPELPASTFLQNNKDSVVNKTKTILGNDNLGLIQDAVWTDLNGDNWQDLVIVGEWMTPLIYVNNEGKLNEQKISIADNLKGLWRCVYAIDIDKDGDEDLVLGNFGTNSRLKASEENPLQLVVGDLDKNGKYDPLMSFYIEDEQGKLRAFPYHTRDDVANQLPIIKSKYKNYGDYGKATFAEVLNLFDKADYELKTVNILESVILENQGGFKFKKHVLPNELQWSPINTIIEMSSEADSVVLLFGMNDNSLDTHTGKLDGQAVIALTINKDFTFRVNSKIGIEENGTVRSLLQIGDQLLVGDEERVRLYETVR